MIVTSYVPASAEGRVENQELNQMGTRSGRLLEIFWSLSRFTRN